MLRNLPSSQIRPASEGCYGHHCGWMDAVEKSGDVASNAFRSGPRNAEGFQEESKKVSHPIALLSNGVILRNPTQHPVRVDILRNDQSMTPSWSTEPIFEKHMLLKSQPVVLKTWNGAANRNNCRQQYYYLLGGSTAGIEPFTMGGEIIPPKVAFGIGQKYGQRRIVISPLNTSGLFLDELACHLATKWGLDEHGWYAAAHYDTAHPHLHIIAETECSITGKKLAASSDQLNQWHLHAVYRVTQVLKTYKAKTGDDARYSDMERSR